MYKPSLAIYEENLGKYVYIPGTNNCSKTPVEALAFALKNSKQSDRATLFVIACQNYNGFEGVQMNNEAYSAYPREAEILLMNGFKVLVLAVDKNVKIEGATKGQLAPYN